MVELNLNDIKAHMDKAIVSLKKDLSGLRVGRASASMLDQVNVNAYGNSMPLNQLSTISVPEARLLLVNVWDNSLVVAAEKSIRESPLGLNPMVEGNVIRINVPSLSEERRIELVKVAGKYSEQAKVSIRNVRRDIIENIRKLEKDSSISEDEKRDSENKIQDITDEFVKEIDNMLAQKEQDIKSV